jgi:hypothetical protein
VMTVLWAMLPPHGSAPARVGGPFGALSRAGKVARFRPAGEVDPYPEGRHTPPPPSEAPIRSCYDFPA